MTNSKQILDNLYELKKSLPQNPITKLDEVNTILHIYAVREVINEFRESGEEIDDKVEQDRYYCYQDVAKKITGSDDLYLGWTYYFGGGKHSQPAEVEWMEDCYLLTYKEVEETRIVKIFEKVEDN